MRSAIAVLFVTFVVACDGPQGPQGPQGPPGPRGDDGADGGNSAGDIEQVVLPGAAFFPENIVAAKDGTLFVTSIGNGSVVKIAPDRLTVTTFLPAQTVQPVGKTGLLLDEATGRLWVCQVANDFSQASTVDRYDLATGTRAESHALATPGALCNDLAIDAAGNLYATNSFFGIERLASGAAAADPLTVWKTDPLYQPATQGAFGVDGIAIDGSNVYTNNVDKGVLVRTPIQGDGTAGTPVAIAGVALAGSDGIRLLAPSTLVVTEANINAISKVVIDPTANRGVRTLLSNRLDRPCGVAIVDNEAWVTDGQIGRFTGSDTTPLNVPFLVERAPIF